MRIACLLTFLLGSLLLPAQETTIKKVPAKPTSAASQPQPLQGRKCLTPIAHLVTVWMEKAMARQPQRSRCSLPT